MILWNTVLVTLAVVFGFTLGITVGVPVWLQGFCLLPACLLFYRLSGTARPSGWKLAGFLAFISAISFVFIVVFPHVPQRDQTLFFVLFVMLAAGLKGCFERGLMTKAQRSDPTLIDP